MGSVIQYHRLPEMPESYSGGPCVFRIQVGRSKKYFIWKTKELQGFLTKQAYELQNKIFKGCKDTDSFYKLAYAMRSSKTYKLGIDVLCETKNIKRLLSFEQDLLKKSNGDPFCLNTDFAPKNPKWIEEILNPTTEPEKSHSEIEPVKEIITEKTGKVSAPPFKFAKKVEKPSPSKKEEPVIIPENKLSPNFDISAIAAGLKNMKDAEKKNN